MSRSTTKSTRGPLQARNLTERVEALDPGLYTADSDTDGYGSLMAAVYMGAAEVIGDYPVENGVKSVAVQVFGGETRVNPAEGVKVAFLRIGEEFYTKALSDYNPWQQMWWREAIQNAVDAGQQKHGADGYTRVTLKTEEQSDGTLLVSCEDDGGGMTEEVLFGKFLTLGPSGKTGVEGAAGGFGEAKRLLLLPWLSYEIHTQNHIARGKFASQELEHDDKAPFLDGTKLTVRMPADKKTDKESARNVIERCYLPRVRITLNGERIYADLEDGDEADEYKGLGKARLHYRPRARKAKGFFVRKNGIYMFEHSIASDLPGYFTLEILAKSTDVLYANRMDFRDWALRGSVSDYLRLLSRDTMTAVKKKRNILKKKWRGSGKFKAKAEGQGDLKAMILQKIGAAEKVVERENIDKIKEILAGNGLKREEEEIVHAAEGTAPPPEGITTKPTVPGDVAVPTVPIIPTGDGPSPIGGPSAERGKPDIVTEIPPGYRPLAPGEELPPGEEVKYLLKKPDEVQPGDIVIWKPFPAGGVPKGMAPNAVPIEEIEVIGEDDEEGTPSARPDFALLPDVAEMILQMLATKGVKGADQVEAIVQQLTWEPDFYIEASIEDFHVSPKFTPEAMSPTLRKIAKFWSSVCCVLLSAIEKGATYGVGWIFKEEWDLENSTWGATKGEYIKDEEGEEWLMLNPFRGGSIKAGDLYSLRSDEDLKLIHAIALHEVVHLVGFHGHDDRYAAALTDNIARVALSLQELKRIRDVVVKRPPDWKPTSKVKKLKFVPDVEKKFKDIERDKGFKESGYETFYLPSNPDDPDRDRRWILEREGSRYDGGRKSILKVGNKKLAETEKMEDDKDVVLMLSRFRAIVAKRRPDLLMPSAEDLSEESMKFFDSMKEALLQSAFDRRRIDADVYTSVGRKQVKVIGHEYGKPGAWDIHVSYGGKTIFDDPVKGKSKYDDGWEEPTVKAVMAKITPMILVELAREEAGA
jgi:hypothetical protein